MSKLNRRTMLRGVLGGAAVSMGLPFLDCFLNTNGTALADAVGPSQRLPLRFGTWIWGCGYIPERWVPTATGKDFTMPADLEPLAPYKDKLAIFSGFDVKLDGVPNKPHITGCLGLRTGIPVPGEKVSAPTLDVLIGDAIGGGTRFSSIEVSTSGIQRSYSFRAGGSPNPSETSPIALYQRIFVEGFQDPNAAKFTPDPQTIVRRECAVGRQGGSRTRHEGRGRGRSRAAGSVLHLGATARTKARAAAAATGAGQELQAALAAAGSGAELRDGQCDGDAQADGGAASRRRCSAIRPRCSTCCCRIRPPTCAARARPPRITRSRTRSR